MTRGVLAACLLAVCASSAAAQDGGAAFDIRKIDPETFRAIAVKITDAQKPTIDGKPTEQVWSLAPAQGNFIQREPQFGKPASEKTEFRILYDDKTLYKIGRAHV